MGIGYVIGPVLGGVLYNIGGYKTPFIVFATIQIILSPLIYTLLKKELKSFHDNQDFEKTLQKEQDVVDNNNIGYLEVFSCLSIFLNFIILTTSTLNYMYFEPIFSTYLHDDYNID